MNQQALSVFIWSVADLLQGDHKPADYGKVILPNTTFGYRAITVERPLLDDRDRSVLFEKGRNKGKPQQDSSLRDTENATSAVALLRERRAALVSAAVTGKIDVRQQAVQEAEAA